MMNAVLNMDSETTISGVRLGGKGRWCMRNQGLQEVMKHNEEVNKTER